MWSYFRNRVVVDVNNSIEIFSDDLCHLIELVKVEFSIGYESVECNGCQIADSHFIWGCVFNYLCTQITGLDSTKILRDINIRFHLQKVCVRRPFTCWLLFLLQ